MTKISKDKETEILGAEILETNIVGTKAPSLSTLADCRAEIDAIDNKLLNLFERRIAVVQRVAVIKKQEGGAAPHKAKFDRESDMIFPLAQQAHLLEETQVHYLYRHIINTFLGSEGFFCVRTLFSPLLSVFDPTSRAVSGTFGFLAQKPLIPQEAASSLLSQATSLVVCADPRSPFFSTPEEKKDAKNIFDSFLTTLYSLKEQGHTPLPLVHYRLRFAKDRLPCLLCFSLPTQELASEKTYLWAIPNKNENNPQGSQSFELVETSSPHLETSQAKTGWLIGAFRPTVLL